MKYKIKKLKPGYWIARCAWYDSNEVVCVSSDGRFFNMIGYDCSTSINSEHWTFIKPFDIEDILNEKDSTERDTYAE